MGSPGLFLLEAWHVHIPCCASIKVLSSACSFQALLAGCKSGRSRSANSHEVLYASRAANSWTLLVLDFEEQQLLLAAVQHHEGVCEYELTASSLRPGQVQHCILGAGW